MSEPKRTWLSIIRIALLIGSLTLSILAGQAAALRRIALLPYQQENGHPARMALVPAGCFIMGSDSGRDDEAPAHKVYLDAYWIDQYEVTNKDYLLFIQETGISPPRYWKNGHFPIGQARYPVVGVRWKDADAYCAWVGKRLPTEAEWEKACRGTGGQVYPWGDSPDVQRANTSFLPEGPQPDMWHDVWDLLTLFPPGDLPALEPVGSYPEGASSFGVYDLVGNASEWVADYYNWDGYWEISDRDPFVLEPAWNHSVRGSAWLMPYGGVVGGYDTNRCSARSSSHGDTRDARMGFRCALSVSK